jgi:hypothetical protein
VGALGDGRDPERPVRDQALTTVDARIDRELDTVKRLPLVHQAEPSWSRIHRLLPVAWVRGEKIGQINAEPTGEVIAANSCILKLLGFARQGTIARPMFKGNGHDTVEHLGNLRRCEAEIAVSPVPYRC